MHRLILSLAAALVAVAALADPVTPEEALEIAKTFAPNIDTPTLVKSATRTPAKARALNSTVSATSPYYIYSRGEGQGYVIVSGDDCLPSVLGYAESGDYDDDNLPPAFYAFLNYYQGLIEDAQAAGENISRNSSKRRAQQKASTKTTISPLMTTAWHQSSPYNSWCPYLTGTTTRAATGCVATAGAQVVYYWHKDNPDYYGATTPTYSYGDAPVTESVAKGTPIKWDLMLDNYNSSYPDEYADAVGEFVFALGAATWLTYGSSTSGQISNLVSTFSSLFNLSGTCVYKGSTSDDSWATTVYNDLADGHPIVYCGYNESSGGHAVVVDGYNASSSLFHFNFGWGGTSDGYYTVDDETGMNGFNSEQGMTYLVAPKTRNISATITQPENYYVSHSNNIQVTLQNNGTLDYTGIYIFAESSSSAPTALSDAKDSDTETTLTADGEDVIINLSVKPATERTYYLTVTDKELNVLDQISVTATPYVNDLVFEGFTIYGSADTQTINGEEYTVVYGTRTTIDATVTNNSDESYEDSPRLEIYVSEDNGETFSLVGNKSATSTVIDAQSTGTMSFSITSTTTVPISTGLPYYAALKNPLSSKATTAVSYTTTDTVARFILVETDDALACELDGDILRFSGTWNAYQFSNYAGKSANSGATSYDLTAVTSLGAVPAIDDKPNALYYVSDDSGITGTNIVNATTHTATDLNITTGYDFAPWADIQADNVTFNIDITPNLWALVTAPCDLTLPDGIFAKSIDSHTASGINNKTTDTRTLTAGQTYLTMISADRNTVVTAADVTVLSAPIANPDTAVVGTYVSTTAPAGACIIEVDDETPYFVPQDADFTVEGLLGYFYASNISKQFRANSSLSLDPRYITLGEAIATAYETLDTYASIVSDEAYQWLSDSIAAAESVWSNRTLTTASAVTAYATALLELLETYKTSYDTGLETTIDMTGLIINPSFETNASGGTSGSLYGWTNGGSCSVKSNSNYFYKGVGADGDYLAYSFSSTDSTGSELSQVVKDGLIPGLYQLTALVGTQTGYTVTLFANDDSATVDAHEFGQYYLTTVSLDSIVILDGDSLNLGIAAGRWWKADKFELTYQRALTAEEDPTAITDIANDHNTSTVALRPTNGGLVLTTSDQQPVCVYTTTGALVSRINSAGTHTIALPAGIYIVDGKKVLVK